MQRIYTYVPASQVLSADLNAFQDRVIGAAQATGAFFGYRPVLSSTGTTNLVIGAHGGVVMGSAVATAITGGPSAGSTIVLAGLAADTWYYVYAYNSATWPSVTVAYEYNTSVPDGALLIKNSDALRTYIGCFRTDSSGNVLPFRSSRNGEYTYRISRVATAGFLVLNTGTAAAAADVSLAGFVPPHARIAVLAAEVAGTVGQRAKLYTKGDTLGYYPLAPGGITQLEIETDSAQTIQYIKDTATSVSLYAVGFKE